jgi:hypothetical protein
MRRAATLVVWASALAASSAGALAAEKPGSVVEVGPALFQPTTPPKAAPKRSDLVLAAPRLPDAARHALGDLSPAERAELLAPDRRGDGVRRKKPAVKIGIDRPLPSAIGFDGLPADLGAGESRPLSGGLLERAADGSLVWTASFSSAGAGALRLHLSRARLPEGSRVYVYGEEGQVQGPYNFSSGTRPEGFWTNTIFADRIFLEVRFPAGASPADLSKAALTVASVVHLEHPAFAPSAAQKAGVAVRPKSQTCFVDRSCVTPAEFSNVDQATRAVAQLTFVDGGSSYVCSGGLMNTTSGSSVPYLLTANHCFSSQASATSLEAVWQYRTASCNGPYPPESQFPNTLTSTLLATGTTSDFTFVQLLENPPTDSVLLGWTTADVSRAGGLVLYRLSYSNGDPMIFTREQVSATPTPDACADAPQGNYLYEKDIQGGTGGGSSGSPALLEDLRVVGQEFGSCGTNTSDDCDVVNNSTIDGAFAVTYPSVRQWLQPGSPGPCVANATTLCLNNARFRVTVFYATSDGSSGTGMAVPMTGDSGYFWFFSEENIELVVKVLSACQFNQKFWVFAGGLTNVGVTLLVEDTVTGASQTYTNPVGTPYLPLQETQAFSCP